MESLHYQAAKTARWRRYRTRLTSAVLSELEPTGAVLLCLRVPWLQRFASLRVEHGGLERYRALPGRFFAQEYPLAFRLLSNRKSLQ